MSQQSLEVANNDSGAVVWDVIELFFDDGRNVTLNNSFKLIFFGDRLFQRKTTMFGTVCGNLGYPPSRAKHVNERVKGYTCRKHLYYERTILGS